MWLFEAPKTYTEMCKKIAQAVFYMTLIELFVLSQISSDFADFMKMISFNTETEVIDIKLYIAYIYVPLAVSVIENIFKLHDRIQKIFDLRTIFEGCILFKAYIHALELKNPHDKNMCNVYRNNKKIREVCLNHFYCYVSDENPKIDAHDVHMALDAWCWVWILLDCIVVSMILCVATFGLKLLVWNINKWLVIGLVIYSMVLAGIMFLQLITSCKKYTTKEVYAAVNADKQMGKDGLNDKVKKEIKNALHNK